MHQYSNISDKEFKEKMLLVMSMAFMNIRSLSWSLNRKTEDNILNKEEKQKAVYKITTIADGFHNIPSLLSKEPIDKERILSELSGAGEEYIKAFNSISSN